MTIHRRLSGSNREFPLVVRHPVPFNPGKALIPPPSVPPRVVRQPVEDVDVMTSKHLGILVLAMVALWSLTGLGGIVSVPSCAVVSVGTAYAGISSSAYTMSTCSGDPDQYTDSADGDPDQYVDGSEDSPSDDGPSDSPPALPDRNYKVMIEMILLSVSFWF